MTKLDELAKLLERATPGPWVSEHHEVVSPGGREVANMRCTTGRYESEESNRNFIAALRNAAPALLACAESLQTILASNSDIQYHGVVGRYINKDCELCDAVISAREALRQLEGVK